MSIGISTACFYPSETEKALIKCGESGAKVCEIFINSYSEISKAFIEELKNIRDFYGMKIVSVHPFSSSFEGFLFFSDYTRRFNDGIEFYKKYADAAAELSAKYLVIHGEKSGFNSISPSEYAERFMILNSEIEKTGVMLTQENVNGYRSASPEFIKEICKHSDNGIKFTFDIKQSVRAKFTPFDILDAMNNNVVNVHVSDHNALNDCILPLKGDFNFEQLFSYMSKKGYQGDYLIEVYKNSYNNEGELVKNFGEFCSFFDLRYVD